MFLQIFQVQDYLTRKYANVILPYRTFFWRNDSNLKTSI